MSEPDDLRKEAKKLHAESVQKQHQAQVDKKASDEVIDRYRAEELKNQAQKKEKEAYEAEAEAKSNDKASNLLY